MELTLRKALVASPAVGTMSAKDAIHECALQYEHGRTRVRWKRKVESSLQQLRQTVNRMQTRHEADMSVLDNVVSSASMCFTITLASPTHTRKVRNTRAWLHFALDEPCSRCDRTTMHDVRYLESVFSARHSMNKQPYRFAAHH